MRTALLSRLRSSFSHRWFVVVFAVPAILIGLLAMHVLTAGSMNEAPMASPSIVSVAHHSDAAATPAGMGTAPSLEKSAGDCGGPCMPSHDMFNMLCVLALLATVILFAARLLLSSWPVLMSVLSKLHRKAVSLAPPLPPSLHVLSISRT
ncbi:hypothetical protein BH11ACT2_BH11ACT2_01660 [soil metagenome]